MPQHNTPKLRFPEFSGAWEEKQLKKMSTFFSGGTPLTTNAKYYNGDIPFIKSGEINAETTSQYISTIGLSKSSAKMVEKGDVLLALYGATSGEVGLSKINGAINQAVLCIRPTEKKEFLYYQLLKNKQAIIQTYLQGGQGNLSAEIIKNLYIKFPTLAEQQKIATFLSAADKKLEQLQQKKSLLEQYKKGMMQKLFSQQIRFKDDNGKEFPEWHKFKLKDVLTEHKEKNINNEFEEVFSVAKHKGVINQIEHLGRSYAAEDISNYKVIFPDDIVYTKSPTSDFPFGIIKQNRTGRMGIVSTLYGVFRPANPYLGFLLDNFFSVWQNTYNYLNPLVQKGAKNTMNINNNEFLNGTPLTLPSSEKEQTKIADFLTAIDDKIAAVSAQVDKAKEFKKGLLQQMFV